MADKERTDDFELTDLQERFVDYFVGECEFDPIKAFQRAGYSSSSHAYPAAMRVLKSKAVKRAIHQRLHESNFWLSEEAIIQRLWKEGLSAKSPAARINALVWVGKHIGMWQDRADKEGSGAVTYNIINYGVPKEEMVEVIESTPQIEEKKDTVSLPEGVEVLSFKEPVPKD